jgi:hypothetical protein
MYLKSTLSILDQNANFPADLDVIEGYLAETNLHLAKYREEIKDKRRVK